LALYRSCACSNVTWGTSNFCTAKVIWMFMNNPWMIMNMNNMNRVSWIWILKLFVFAIWSFSVDYCVVNDDNNWFAMEFCRHLRLRSEELQNFCSAKVIWIFMNNAWMIMNMNNMNQISWIWILKLFVFAIWSISVDYGVYYWW
jgi:hypothetical protein